MLDFLKRERVDDPWEWLREHGYGNASNGRANSQHKIVATYDYTDEFGTLLFQVVRLAPKTFRQRRPDGKGGWIWNLEGVTRVLYRLPDLIEAIALERRVFVVEGEKDVETLARLGIVATCNPGGAGKWRDAYADQLAGADVVVLPDHDKAGRDHAEAVARSLAGKAARIRLLELPGLPDKGDASDWFAAGGTVETFNALADQAPDWTVAGGTKDAIIARIRAARGEQNRAELVTTTGKAARPARLMTNDKLRTTPARYSVGDLQHKSFPTLKRIAGDIIVEGLTLLAARPKVGKTWLALDIAVAVATGGIASAISNASRVVCCYSRSRITNAGCSGG